MSTIRKALLLASLVLAVGLAACGSGSAGTTDRITAGSSAPSLKHCPKEIPGLPGGSPGARGSVVRETPVSAVLCRWRAGKDGTFTRSAGMAHRSALRALVSALNSLPPAKTGPVECESGINLWYLVGFRFRDGSGAEVEADYGACGAVLTRRHHWGIDAEVGERIDALFDR